MVVTIIIGMIVIPASAVPAVMIAVIRSGIRPDMYGRIIVNRRVISNRIIPHRSIIVRRITERESNGKSAVPTVVVVPPSSIPGIIIDGIVEIPHGHRRIGEHPDPCAVRNNRRVKGCPHMERGMEINTGWRRRHRLRGMEEECC